MSDAHEPAKPAARSGPALATIDMSERAGERTGNPQVVHGRLFMQLLVYTSTGELGSPAAARVLSEALAAAPSDAVIYADLHDPRGVGVLTWSEDPEHFVTRVRRALHDTHRWGLALRHEYSMFGRTYATGYEPDLRHWLLDRPRQTVKNPAWPWAVWYPLRRIGKFARLEDAERGSIMAEHGKIGRAYGEQDLAHDVRLACYGLDARDNEFVIGLIGKDLHPLSHVVESMRRTRQTAEFMEQMGPFFVGHVLERVGA
jgi:chlorite dismutase